MNPVIHRSNIYSLIVLIIAVIVIDFYVAKQAKQNSLATGELRAVIDKGMNLAQLQKDYNQHSIQIAKLEPLLPNQETFPQMVDHLERSADQSGVNLKFDFGKDIPGNASPNPLSAAPNTPSQNNSSSSKSAPPLNAPAPSIDFLLTADGTVSQLVNFYESLEKSPYFFSIVSANFETPDGLDNQAILSSEVKVYVDSSLKP